MNIGVIGAGQVGRAIAGLGVRHGHKVMLSNSRGPETLAAIVTAIGCEAGTVEQAAAFGDIIVVAIPLKSILAIPAAPLAGKIVVDTNNYYPDRDGHIPELDAQATTTSETLARHIPAARTVKAFNAIMMRDLEGDGRPSGSPGRRALPIAGDDREAKRVVADLLDQFGYDVVNAGALAEGWRFERARPAYCVPLDRAALSATLAATTRHDFVAEGSWRR